MAQARRPLEKGVNETTIAALATAPGRSALGIVRVSGPQCRSLAKRLLGPEPLAPRQASARLLTHDGRPVDRVVATFWAAPNTPTGEDLLELTAHGSPEILRDILQAALAAGASPAAPGEFTRRAFVNGRLDLPQARAVADLIAARGSAARAAALTRLEGGLSSALEQVRSPILDLLAQIEVRLDHPEEDLPALPDGEAGEALERCAAGLKRLLSGYERGRARRTGARIGLFGLPNAGKSSLFNALLGRPRAITAPQPGTTRDVLEEQAELGGHAVTLVDTAGLRQDAADPAEREGVARAEQALASCAVAVLVLDAARPADADDDRAREAVAAAAARSGARLIVALNKMDLLGGTVSPSPEGVPCSALTGRGISELEAAIAAAAGTSSADEGESLLDDAAQRDALGDALDELRAARAEIASRPGTWEDRAADRLRRALTSLSRAAGENPSEAVLDQIFSRFCIGK